MVNLFIYTAMFPASVLSGMLGIGVAFAAIPILGVADIDLVHGVQPIALLLNGVSALFSAISFGRAGHIDWRTSTRLAIVATVFAPLGAFAAQSIEPDVLWWLYFSVVAVVIYLLLARQPVGRKGWPTGYVLAAGAPVSALSGLLGVGPGFLMVPLMVYSGLSPQRAAAINAVAVTPSSFAALAPHLGHVTAEAGFVVPIVICAAAGALLGGHLSSRRMPEAALRRLFIALIICLASYKALTLLDQHAPAFRWADNCAYSELRFASFSGNGCP